MTMEEAMNMSNEQAVQILIPMRNMMCDRYGCPISDAVFALDKAIEALSADRPTGEWIQEDLCAYKFCSCCNYAVWGSEAEEYNYCPNCGAIMVREGGE